MFVKTDIIEFINRIINSPKGNEEEIEANIEKFRDYLELTKMADADTIGQINRILNCLNSLIVVKNVLGCVDISAIINAPIKEPEQKKLRKVPKKQTEYTEKHYRHYHEDDQSSWCGSRSSSSSSCGSTSRSGC